MLRPPLTPVTTVDRSRRSRPLPSTAVTIVAAHRRQPPSAIAVDCRHRDRGGGRGDEGEKTASAAGDAAGEPQVRVGTVVVVVSSLSSMS